MRIKPLIFTILLLFIGDAFADDFVSTGAVVKEIEKTLLFDKSSRQQIDFYKQQKAKNKSDNASINSSKSSSDQMTVVVEDVKINNADLREKERMAYNAVLVGQYEVAIELYKQVLAKEPNNNYSKFALATVYQKIGQFKQAKTIYYQMLKSNPDNQDDIVNNLLDILIEDSPQDATYLLSRLALQNPDSADVMAYAGMAYNKVKNYDRSVYFFEKAIILDQNNVSYKYNLAVVFDRMEKYKQAVELYSRVIRETTTDVEGISLDQIKKRIEFLKSKI